MTPDRHTHLNLDDFPNSPHAAELRHGVSHRGFAPALEQEYVARHLDHVQRRVRAWFTVAFVTAVIFTLIQGRTTGWGSPGTLLQLLLTVCSVSMVLVVWTGFYRQLFTPLSRILSPVMLATSAAVCAINIAQGEVEQISVLTINVFAAFFFCGLMFNTALAGIGVMLMAYVVAALGSQMAPEFAVAGVLLVLVTAGISAVVSQEVHAANRRNFLEGVLIRELAARDGLTGVMNRRAFDEHLLRLWQQGMRDKRTIALLMIDLDHFKALNDLHGHQAGDAALRRVAQSIQDFARRPLDMAARYGGEEFAVLLYDFAETQLPVLAEQLRRAIESLRIEHGAPAAGPVVTVSIGVGLAEPAIDRTPQGAIQLADEALYEAKRQGRNRVVIRGADQHRSLKTGSFNSSRETYQTRSSGTANSL